MVQALMLKIAALSLLLLLQQNPNLPADFQSQALATAQSALAAADQAMSDAASSAIATSSSPAPTQATNIPATSPTPTAVPQNVVQSSNTPMPPASQARIEIISPIGGKGLGREYKAADQPTDESNYIELAAIVYDGGGNTIDNADMVITATDASQNKEEKGTGDQHPIYVDGSKRIVPIYSYHYEFHSPGAHTITFAANGLTQSVTVNVQ